MTLKINWYPEYGLDYFQNVINSSLVHNLSIPQIAKRYPCQAVAEIVNPSINAMTVLVGYQEAYGLKKSCYGNTPSCPCRSV